MTGPATVTAEAFEALYRRTSPEVLGFLRRRVGDEAPDLLADVYVLAWEKRDKLPAEWLRRAWLFGMARRLLLSHSRQTSRDAAAEVGAALLASQPPHEPEQSVGATVRAALMRLAEIDRELIQLTEWEQLSITEAAVATGLKPGTARVRLHRARTRLAQDPELAALVTTTAIPR
ncbi:RNA polymerase sigma factor [Nocardioides sp. DS6]|uniref:RNA polymerase sigma factor n=1 Tax=Nocardioides eburneus TaxID=3231482 RepID=A0ABV3SSU5_9ACTN